MTKGLENFEKIFLGCALALLLTGVASVCVQGQTSLSGNIFKDLEVTNSITKNFGDSAYHFHVKMLNDEPFESSSKKRYYWFHQGEVRSTIGASVGKVLHGPFEKFDHDGNLREKGNFDKGTKDGLWLQWYVNGNLARQLKWDEGLRKGPFEEYYENGNVSRKGSFSKDQLHGKVTLYNPDGSEKRKEIYKNGSIKRAKDKRVRKVKSDRVEKSNQTNTDATDSKEKETTKKRLFKRRARTPADQNNEKKD